MKTSHLTVSGQVQGVGFRPFIYRLAHQHQLKGTVSNQTGKVIISVQGEDEAVSQFTADILNSAPPLARPSIESAESSDEPAFSQFEILASVASDEPDIHIPADFFACDDCIEELSDGRQRRFQYPFTNCTQCGPRYTIIEALPYDRIHTSMRDFPLCEDCKKEYTDPADRRFHAQPLACEKCGPQLTLSSPQKNHQGNETALSEAIKLILSGKILAIKGIGGYHLVCDAQNPRAIATLRKRKQRPDKPLAVMFPMTGEDGLDAVKYFTRADNVELEQIRHPLRPIVLVRKKDDALPENIAPGLNEIGVFLPYSPLHHLLLKACKSPLIATSGNVSGEPVITDNDMAEQKLSAIADAFLHHDRPIVRPADDSVQRFINNKTVNIRLGRGLAPLELPLQFELDEPVLAVGGHLKSTIALAWNKRIVISPHISDLDSARGMQVFEQVIGDLQTLYQVEAQRIICDRHSGYQSHRWALKQELPVTQVAHHHAHASAFAGDQANFLQQLVFCWDGVGLGLDNTLWGGETFIGQPGKWQRIASFEPFKLPGGDKAGREPWRSAAAIQWQMGNTQLIDQIEHAELTYQAWQKNVNTPQSSAAGRLFDAAACMILGITHTSFEGQAPMILESIVEASTECMPLLLKETEQQFYRIDWHDLMIQIQNTQLTKAERATLFHNSLAQNVIDQALFFKQQYDFETIGLSGGVFQNKVLSEKILALGKFNGLDIRLPQNIPVNDAGICYGQVIEFAGVKGLI